MTELARIDELVCDDVLWGLSDQEQSEFRELAGKDGRDAEEIAREREQLELVAAEATLALCGGRLESPPEAVHERLRVAALGTLMMQRGLGLADIDSLGSPPPQQPHAAADEGVRDPGNVLPGPRPWLSQVVAAAAILIAVWAVWSRPPAEISPQNPGSLLATDPDIVRIPWSDASGVLGEVVWSKSEQRGFMRFQGGIAKNDPSSQRYQLWIFDNQRNASFPVDGGVFDVAADGEIVVPIDAKLPVLDVGGFAVTKERPDGVVVSERTQVVTTAGL